MKLVQLFLTIILVKGSICYDAVVETRLPGRRYATSIFFNGEDSIYLFGGHDGDKPLDEILKYTFGSGNFEEVGNLPEALGFGTMAPTANIPAYFGGFDSNHYAKSSIFTFNIANETIEYYGEMSTPLALHSSVSDPFGNIYVFGGPDSTLPYPLGREIVAYDFPTNHATIVGQLAEHEGVRATGAAWCGESIYVFGGQGPLFTHNVSKITPSTGSVEVFENVFPMGLGSPAVVTVGNYIYIIGGFAWIEEPGEFHRFDTTTNTVESLPLTNFPRSNYYTSAVYAPATNGIYLFGGVDRYNVIHDEVYYIQL